MVFLYKLKNYQNHKNVSNNQSFIRNQFFNSHLGAYQKRVKTNDASFLLCLPVFSSSCDYDFSVETEEKDVRHSPRSYPHHCYDEYIPNKLHKSSSFKEEDEF